MDDRVAEVIAYLSALEKDLENMQSRVKEYKHMLFEALDNDLTV